MFGKVFGSKKIVNEFLVILVLCPLGALGLPAWSMPNNPRILDLHGGLSEKDAFAKTVSFIEDKFNNFEERCRVITGRGNHINSNGTRGVLFKAFPNWVETPKLKQLIKEFVPAPDGGSYAVFLNKKVAQTNAHKERKRANTVPNILNFNTAKKVVSKIVKPIFTSVKENDPRIIDAPEFVKLGSMFEMNNLIWSGVATEQMGWYEGKSFCESLDGAPGFFWGKWKGEARLPTGEEYEDLAKAMGKCSEQGYSQNVLPHMVGYDVFWSSSMNNNNFPCAFSGRSGDTFYEQNFGYGKGFIRCVRVANPRLGSAPISDKTYLTISIM